MKSKISSHQKQSVAPKTKQVGRNYRVKNCCSIDNKCQLIYQAVVRSNLDDEYKYYLELEETTFKERYSNHKSLFKNEDSKNCTVQNCQNMFGH